MNKLIVNVECFAGVFSRKGRKCARIDDPFTGQRWIPTGNQDVIVARKRACSENYLPVECVPESIVATLKDWQIWHGISSGTPLVWMRDLPASGIRLTSDWHTYASVDGGRARFTVPAGTLVIPGEPGNLYESGWHWEA